jgi:hypothetical protein
VCKACAWQDLANTADAMAIDPRYRFADLTLLGISRNIVRAQHASDAQRTAVYNIKDGKGRSGSTRSPSPIRRLYIPDSSPDTT